MLYWVFYIILISSGVGCQFLLKVCVALFLTLLQSALKINIKPDKTDKNVKDMNTKEVKTAQLINQINRKKTVEMKTCIKNF